MYLCVCVDILYLLFFSWAEGQCWSACERSYVQLGMESDKSPEKCHVLN